MAIYKRFIRLILAICLLLSPWFYGLTGYKHQLCFSVITLFLFLVCLWNTRLETPVAVPLLSLDAVAIGFLGLLFYGLLISALPNYSLMTVMKGASLPILYFFVRISHLKRGHAFKCDDYLLKLIVVSGVIYSIYGIIQYYGFIDHSYWYQPNSLGSRYVNGGHFAAFLTMPFFIACAFLLISKNGWVKIVLGITLCLLSLTIVLTRSRTVWVAIVFGILCFIFILALARIFSFKMLLIFLLAAAGGCVVLWQLKAGDKIIERFSEIWDGHRLNAFSIIHRFELWEGSLRAIAARLQGWGAGTFVHIFPQFNIRSDRFLEDYAHNEFLQTGVEYGVIGIIFLISALFISLISVLVYIRRSEDTESKIHAAAFLGCVVTLFLSSQFDFPLRIYGSGVFLIVYAAVIAQGMGEIIAKMYPQNLLCLRPLIWKWMRVIITAAALVMIILLSKAFFAHLDYRAGLKYEENFEWDKAIDAYERASRKMPSYSDYYEALGRLYHKKYLLTFKRDAKEAFLKKAIESFQNAIRTHPYWPASYYVLGRIFEERAEVEKAKQYYYDAKVRDPNNPIYVSAYAYFLLNHGHLEEAVNEFEYFKGLSYKEGVPNDPCTLLKDISKKTQEYRYLKRIVQDRWTDHFCLGKILGELGMWNEAAAELTIAAQGAREQYDFQYYMEHVAKGIVSFYISHNKKLDHALEIYRYAIQKEPNNMKYQEEYKRIEERIKMVQGDRLV